RSAARMLERGDRPVAHRGQLPAQPPGRRVLPSVKEGRERLPATGMTDRRADVALERPDLQSAQVVDSARKMLRVRSEAQAGLGRVMARHTERVADPAQDAPAPGPPRRRSSRLDARTAPEGKRGGRGRSRSPAHAAACLWSATERK